MHCPEEQADARGRGGARRPATGPRELLFGETPVRFPLDVAIVNCYADA